MLRRMLKTWLLMGLLVSWTAHGETLTLWASGVNAQSGWFDANKSAGREDSELCWAITAANLIAWWQEQRPDAVPEGTPRGDAVWQVFRGAFSNEGSDPDEAMSWWFSGVYEPRRAPGGLRNAVVLRQDAGAYYRGMNWKNLLYRAREPQLPAGAFTRAFVEGFGQGDAFWVGVSFRKPDGNRYTHAITVWGVDYERDAAGHARLTALYMTDSDDRRVMLHRIPLREEGGRLLFDCSGHPIYGGIGDITVNNYTGLRVRESKGGNNQFDN